MTLVTTTITDTHTDTGGHTLTITTTVELPVADTFPMSIPTLGEAFNTASAVANLYDRCDG